MGIPDEGSPFQAAVSGRKQLRLVEYSHDFVEPDWCVKGHTGYVLDGEFEIDFRGTVVHYHTGDAILIPPGAENGHKARILTPTATVFLSEDV
ncbi:MAG: cupin domain-containing protein [Brevinematales bacterium]|nr:cupin domain-containing protein [Brevinematales bacterium]